MVAFLGGLLIPLHCQLHIAYIRPAFFISLADAVMGIRVNGKLVRCEGVFQIRHDVSTTFSIITIVNFDSRCAAEAIGAIEALRAQGADKLLFDVRNNPGGYKHELVELLDYLLPEGPLFRSVDYSGKEAVDMSDASCLELPMAVLMNGDSYSAAEFFAAALREYGVATLVGQNTTGKGRFQSTYVLSDGSAATISVGTYCTPKGVDLTDVGLTPDIPVEVDEEMYLKIYYGQVPPAEDPQIQAAVAALLEKTP